MMRGRLRIYLLLSLCLLLGGAVAGHAASTTETRAFAAATKSFQDKLYPLAEKTFSEFLGKFPESTLKTEALLYVGISRLYQTNYDSAIDLFRTGLKEEPRLGALADQFFFWLAESLFQKGNLPGAAAAYAEVARRFPLSSRRLEASYNEALCYSRLGQWPRVTDLLLKPEGSFQIAARPQPQNEFSFRGWLLLAEALYRQNRQADAEQSLKALPVEVPAEIGWRRQLLLARIHLAAGKSEAALLVVTNIVAAPGNAGQRPLQAETAFLEGEIFEKLERSADAVQAYERNLNEINPPEIRRRALGRIVDLTLQQGKTQDAVKRLQTFIEQNPKDPAVDSARLAYAELLLRQYFENVPAAPALVGSTNLIDQALTNLSRVEAEFPASALLGKVALNQGWCFWAKGDMAAAETLFGVALQRLPFSEDQATALFKTADTQFRAGRHEQAITNYNLLLQNYGSLPRVKEELFESALYQILRASLALGNQAVARDAMARILASYPTSTFAERSVLMLGQELTRRGDPGEARTLFGQFLQRFTNSALLPDIELAVARSYAQEQQWSNAITKYDAWVTNFASHPLRPEAEFARALTYGQAGRETNALALFTNFVARFATNHLAPRAQNWVATFYFNHDDFANAEKNYQLLYQTLNPGIEMSCQARLNAGRAAFELQQLRDARNYFSDVINESNAPPAIAAQAWYALGDTIFQQFIANTNQPQETFGEAIRAFAKVTQDYPTNMLAMLAWGRIGDCNMFWAELKSDRAALPAAAQAYRNAIRLADLEPAAQHQARVGLARVMEKTGDSAAALENYAKVLYEESDKADPFWLKEAALGAARVCEGLEQWEQAINIYRRLSTLLPATQSAMEKRIASARQHLDRPRSDQR